MAETQSDIERRARELLAEEVEATGHEFAASCIRAGVAGSYIEEAALRSITRTLSTPDTDGATEAAARAIMLNDCCGCTLETGERVFCNDDRLPDQVRRGSPDTPCECQSNARAAVDAIRNLTPTGGNDAHKA